MTTILPGLAIAATFCFALMAELTDAPALGVVAGLCMALFIALSFVHTTRSERAFVAVAIGLTGITMLTSIDWLSALSGPLISMGFIGAFFTAVSCLRNAALTSSSLDRSGRYFAEQPPGRRYAMLTVGGHLFSIMLSFGALSLLGAMVERNARNESDERIRQIRMRRMLLAIQRGLVGMLCWSPIALPMALATLLVPGARWSTAAPACFGAAAILMGLGWVLDSLSKSKLARGRITAAPMQAGSHRDIMPLLLLLVIMFALLLIVHEGLDLRAAAAVMFTVPIVSLVWIALQSGQGINAWAQAFLRARNYILEETPQYRSEYVILAMAGYIGSLGAIVAAPLLMESGINLAAWPTMAILLGIVWVMPVTGQLGMNPILALSLIAPLLPTATEMGVSPAIIVLSLTSGWALSGATSPFTATTLILSRLGNVKPRAVGIEWNGWFVVLGAMLLSLWIVAVMIRSTH